MIRIKVYDYWQTVWRKWSVRFNAIGILILGYALSAPDTAIRLWAILPDELKSKVPSNYSIYISLCFFTLGLISNYIKQEKLQEKLNSLKWDKGIIEVPIVKNDIS